jgi:ribosome-associated protein
MQEALKRPKPRKPTRPTTGAKERRLDEKRRRSEIKRFRGAVRQDE